MQWVTGSGAACFPGFTTYLMIHPSLRVLVTQQPLSEPRFALHRVRTRLS
jgi:hypothetical protein